MKCVPRPRSRETGGHDQLRPGMPGRRGLGRGRAAQLAWGSAASAPPTAPKGTAAPATSGPRSASLSSWKGPCVLGEGRRMAGHQALKSSSVAAAHPAWFANGPSGPPHREPACASAVPTKAVLSLEEGRSRGNPEHSDSTWISPQGAGWLRTRLHGHCAPKDPTRH